MGERMKFDIYLLQAIGQMFMSTIIVLAMCSAIAALITLIAWLTVEHYLWIVFLIGGIVIVLKKANSMAEELRKEAKSE